MDVAAKLAKYAHLMNEHGVDSVEARKFLDDNGEDDEFTDLALLSHIPLVS